MKVEILIASARACGFINRVEALTTGVYLMDGIGMPKERWSPEEKADQLLMCIERLRRDEGSNFTIYHPNPDFEGACNVIDVSHDFNKTTTRFEGETLADCIVKATAALVEVATR